MHYEISPTKAKQSVRYDIQTKRKIRVTVDELGNVTEEPIPSKIRDLKLELRKKQREKNNTRRSQKEEILKEIRERKERESRFQSNERDEEWRKMLD